MHKFASCFLLAVVVGGCTDPQEQCGDPPAPAIGTRYQIVEAATGADWFAGPGRPPGDSLRLLASSSGPGLKAMRIGTSFYVGPVSLFAPVATHYLHISATDIDTVVVRLEPGSQRGPCPSFVPEKVEITYNGRPNGIYLSADSVRQFIGANGLVRLRKR